MTTSVTEPAEVTYVEVSQSTVEIEGCTYLDRECVYGKSSSKSKRRQGKVKRRKPIDFVGYPRRKRIFRTRTIGQSWRMYVQTRNGIKSILTDRLSSKTRKWNLPSLQRDWRLEPKTTSPLLLDLRLGRFRSVIRRERWQRHWRRKLQSKWLNCSNL